MKSVVRQIGGYKATETRHRNMLRQKALGYFKRKAETLGYGLPNILRHPEGGWELSIDFGNDYRFLRFESWGEAADYLISLAPHC